MKSLLLADDRTELHTKLEPILKHWGYAVVGTGDPQQTSAALRDYNPALALIGSNLLTDPHLEWPDPAPPYIALAHPQAAATLPAGVAPLPFPIDIFELYRRIQIQIEEPPRKNLRLRLRLPGMYSQGKSGFVVAELLSLSLGGLLFRSPLRVKVGARLNAIFPCSATARRWRSPEPCSTWWNRGHTIITRKASAWASPT